LAVGPDAWRALLLIDDESLQAIQSTWEGARRFAEAEWQAVEETKTRLYLWQEPAYPALLRQISTAPPIIYVRGQPLGDGQPALAFVGSRRSSYYGERMARQLAGDVAEAGVVVVSGLARGIDSHAHAEALARGGQTWAVLGSGLDRLYPRENKKLAEKIMESGALISEFPLATQPLPAHFPRRNRTIAGLTYGTVVVEGDEKSGSLITARLATEEGREVFAVPGPVTSSLSNGPHILIQNGAKLVRHAADILEECPENFRALFKPVAGVGAEAPPEYRGVLEELKSTPLSRDILTERCRIDSGKLGALITEMELRGLVRSLPGGLVQKT
jgi:DNA processing protein